MVNKMKTVRKIELGFYLMVLNLCSFTLVAQDEDPGFPIEGNPGEPAAPIDQWLLPMFVLGLVLVYWYTRKSIFSNSK